MTAGVDSRLKISGMTKEGLSFLNVSIRNLNYKGDDVPHNPNYRGEKSPYYPLQKKSKGK